MTPAERCLTELAQIKAPLCAGAAIGQLDWLTELFFIRRERAEEIAAAAWEEYRLAQGGRDAFIRAVVAEMMRLP